MSLTKFNSIIENNLNKGETYLTAFNRFHKNGAFTGQLKVQGDEMKQTKFLDESLVYPPYEKIKAMNVSEQDELFRKELKAIQNYFPDIIILSAVIHRDEVFNPLDEEMQALFPQGKNSLAIKLDFCMVLRIGELKVLQWDDIKGDYIYVHAFMNEKN